MKKLKSFLLTVITILFSISCEIGLGASVDTEAPSLEITNPPSDAIIRDEFSICGTWGDDGTISSVTVEMVRLDNKSSVPFTGSFSSNPDDNKNGTWNVVINPSESGLSDGTYEALVAIHDDGGHTTTMARSFTLDNTPPVMLLSRPSVKMSQAGFDNYGRSFTLEGKAADDSGVSLIEVSVYDMADTSNTPLKTIKLQNVPLTIEQDVAVFDSDNETMKSNYAAIYGHTDENGQIRSTEMNNTEQRYCTIKIYDDAQRYPSDGSSQSEEDKQGNSTDVYYMDTDVSTLLEGKYKITELYNMLNGSYGIKTARGAAAESEAQTVINTLRNVEVRQNKFSINPSNNPKYIVTSANAKESGKNLDNIDYQFTAGNRYLEVEITPGLDGYAIEPNSVGVYLQECDVNGVIAPDAPKITLIDKGEENHPLEGTDISGLPADNKKGLITISGKTYKFKTTKVLDKSKYDVSIGHYYAVVVEGNDSQGAESGKIIADGLYAFKLISSGEKIELSGHGSSDYVTTREAFWKPENQPEKKFKVTLNWNGGEAPFYIFRTGSPAVRIAKVENQTLVNGELIWQAEEEFTYDDLHALRAGDNVFPETLNYVIKAYDETTSTVGDILSTEARIKIKTEENAPRISINEIENAYYNSTENKYYVRNVSGNNCTIKGIATDDTGIDNVQLEIPGYPAITPVSDNRFEFSNIDFSILTADHVTAKILATDVAGNIAECPIYIYFDRTAPAGIHEFDAKNKDLYFRIGDLNGGKGSKYSEDTYGNDSTIKIRGYFDDSRHVVNPKDPATFALENSANASGLSMIYYKKFTSVLPPTEEQLSNFEAHYADAEDESNKADGSFKPCALYTKSIDKNGSANPVDVPTNYEESIAGFDGTKTYLALVAVDNVGNAALERFKQGSQIKCYYTMNKDNLTPSVIAGKEFEKTLYIKENATGSLVIYGKATDADAGIDTITVKVNDKDITTTESANGKITLFEGNVVNKNAQGEIIDAAGEVAQTEIHWTENGTEKTEVISTEYKGEGSFTYKKVFWKLEISASVFAGDDVSGNISVYATAKDNAGVGNSQTVTIATVNVDKDAPDVEIRTPCKATDTSPTDVNKTIQVSGIASDPSQLKELLGLYYHTGSVSKPADNTEISALAGLGWTQVTAVKGGTNNWNFTGVNTLEGFSDNTVYSLTVAVSDMAGNIGYAETAKIKVNQNSDRPVINLSQISEKSATVETTLKTKNVYGSIRDDDGSVNKMWYWSARENNGAAPAQAPTASADNGWTPVTVSGNSWSIESPESDGETTWYFAIQDAENNIFWTCAANQLERPYLLYKDESEKKDNTNGVSFKYDTNPPSVISLELYREPTNSSLTLAQVVNKDTNADTSDDVSWTTESKIAFGGKYNILFARVTVTESTGMKALTGSAGSVPTSSPVSISYPNAGGGNLKYEQIAEVHDSTTENNNYVYYLGPIVMNTTEENSFQVTVEDSVGNKGYISREIIVDNTAPVSITGVKPKKGSPETGVVNYRGGVNDNTNGSGILYKTNAQGEVTEYGLQYYIPKYSERNVEPSSITSGWTNPTTPGTASWEIEFTDLGADIGYNAATYTVGPDYSGYETSADSGLYDIPVWFRLTDNVGNVGYNTSNAITYNPNADRPTIDFTYPVHDKTMADGTAYVSMGGTITISGMATDDDGISAVYLQFDTDGDGVYENAIKPGAYTSSEIETIPGLTESGIKAKGTKSWYYTMSVTGMSGLNAEIDGKTLNVRAIAIENDQDKIDSGRQLLSSAWTKNPLHISVNNNVPNFSNIKLKRFETAPTAASLSTAVPSAEINYTAEIYINGNIQWYLVGDVEVTSGAINKLQLSGTQSGMFIRTDSSSTNTITAYMSDSDKKCTFAIPITLPGNVTTGAWKTELYVEDATSGTPSINRYPVTVNLDSEAPEFADKDGSLIKLYKNAYGRAGVELNRTSSNNYVQNSNGTAFTLAGKVTETGSGFDKLVFYYQRSASNGSNKRIYNPMEEHGDDNQANRVDLAASKTNGSVALNAEELPVLYLTNVTRSTEVSLTSDVIMNNKNIRKGGLIKLGGVYRIIDDVEDRDTIGTITFTPSCSTSYKEVEFVYGMVVDHNGESEKNDGSVKNDDGDGMLESFTKAGSNYTWDATINSKNIPDGPIEIHCVVFDTAGNSRHGYTETKVSNNPPRITSVKLGTDLNSDNKYDLDSEFQTYYANFNANGSGNTKAGLDIWNLNTGTYSEGTDYWIAKKDLVVIPEFVGGSGSIYYHYEKTVADTLTDKTTAQGGSLAAGTLKALKTSDPSIVSLLSSTTAAELTVSQTDNRTGAIILKNDSADGLEKIGHGSGEDKVNLYTFSFWDSTEECTVGSDTQWSVLNARFKQDLLDNTAPTGSITPFYWESKNKNSVYYENGNAKGHIELPSDLPSSFADDAEDKEMDRDPKVSGRIKIEGSAFDETLLGSITLSFDGKAVTAEYNKETKLWTYTGNSADFTLAVTDTYGPLQTGHSVTWTYIVDSSKIEDIAKNDVAINLTITDASSAVSGGNSKTVAPYQVDVVPYITGVTTAFSAKLKSSIRDAYSRTTLGHYIARADETITIKGFNISSTGEKELNVSTLESGPYSITVNGVKTLNNLNDNNACGSYKTATTGITEDSQYSDKESYAYNRKPNRTSNNLLTDDVVIDIWQFDSDAAVPRSGELREPIMSINPKTGKIGLAFVSGPGDFAMAGGLNNSYDADSNKDPTKDIYSYSLWQNNYATYNNIAFAYDALGFAHATGTGLDTNPGSGSLHAGRFSYFYNRWGRSGSDTNGNYYGERAVRLESLAVPSWYRSDADFKTEMTTNTYPVVPEWTKTTKDFEASYLRNLAGQIPTATMYKLPIKGSIPETSSLTETRFFSPSIAATVHGSGDSASTAVYLAYYDSTQGQIRFRYSQEVPKTWVKGETTSTDGKTIQSTTFEKWSVDKNKNVTVDENYNEEYLTGAEIALDANGKFSGAGTFQSHMHHALNDKDDFVDNLGYFYKSKDYQAYMEANTDHFSLIAGTDYQLNSNGQKNEADFIVEDIPDRLIDADAIDNDGNAAEEKYIRYRKTKIDKDAIVIEGNDFFKFVDVNGVKHLRKSGTSNAYIVEGEGNEIKLKYNFKNTDALYGQYTYQVADLATDTKAAAIKNYGYPVFVRIKGANGNPVDSNTCEYLIPTIETVKIPVHQKQKYPSGYNTGYSAYKYVAIDAKTESDGVHDTVVAVWYDGTNCRYAYNDNPTSGKDNGSAGGWKGNKIIFTEGGEHCTVKFDSEGGVHIAAYVDGSLRYAYLSSADAAYNEATDSVKVDSFTITGERITLDTGKDEAGRIIPYISYFNGTARLPAVAKLIAPASGAVNYKAQGTGTDDGEDVFTGNWEISLVPSPKTLTTNYYDKMNICLWKQNGVIVRGDNANFTISKSKKTNDNSSNGTNGDIYGNGTANPILGYAVESTSGTCLETAQMK